MTNLALEDPERTQKHAIAVDGYDDDDDDDDKKTPLLPPKDPQDSFAEENGSGYSGASYSSAVFNLSTTIIGAGIMALPATLKVLGVFLGIAAILFVGFLTDFSVGMLLRFSKAAGTVSYGGVMGNAFGNVGKKLVQICIVINNIGILTVYMIIIGDVVSGTTSSGVHHPGLLEGWFGVHWWTERGFILLVSTVAVFGPLASLKRIDSLRFSSALAVVLAIVFLVLTAGITIFKLVLGRIHTPRLFPEITDMGSVWGLFTAVPVLVTSYICHFNVHSIEHELEDPTRIRSVVRTSIALCSIVYVIMSLFGFLLFGDSTNEDVLANFGTDLGIPYSSLLCDIVRVSYVLHLMLVFPILFYPLRVSLDGLIFPSATALASSNWRFAAVSLGLLVVVFIAALFIPSIWDAFQFTGATTAVCLGFIFPSAIALRDPNDITIKRDKIVPVLLIGLSVFSSLVAIYSNARALLEKDE